MKKTALIIFLFICLNSYSQIKVAILDFENTSGISKYDGFGKALSNMLITDLKNSIHPRKVSFLERSQLNKILDEQNLQKSKNFDKSTAVNFGKLAGVKYVLVGSVYVMDGTCNITSRLVDVQTSEIVHAKESNGKITNWLSLKSVLANELSTAMNNPVTIEAEYSEKETSEGVLTQYAKVIDKMDEGDIEGAQEMTEMLSAVQPDFKYFDELKLDIEQLKKQVKENTEDISELKKSDTIQSQQIVEVKKEVETTVLDPISVAYNSIENNDFKTAEKYFLIGLERVEQWDIGAIIEYYYHLARCYNSNKKYTKSLDFCNKALKIYPFFNLFVDLKVHNLVSLKQDEECKNYLFGYLNNIEQSNDKKLFTNKIEEYYRSKNLKVDNIDYGNIYWENSTVKFGSNVNFYLSSDYTLSILYYLCDLIEKESGVESVLKFLDKQKILNQDHAIRSFRLSENIIIRGNTDEDKVELVFSESGRPYKGDFIVRKKGGYISTNDTLVNISDEIISVRFNLITKENYIEKEKNYYVGNSKECNLYFALGWYCILNKEFKKASLIYQNIVRYNFHRWHSCADKVSINKDLKVGPYTVKAWSDHSENDLISCLSDSNPFKRYADVQNMSVINWGHTFLLDGNFSKALKIYLIFSLDDKFGKEWGNISVSDAIKSDLNDFQKLGLIDEETKNKVLKDLSVK